MRSTFFLAMIPLVLQSHCQSPHNTDTLSKRVRDEVDDVMTTQCTTSSFGRRVVGKVTWEWGHGTIDPVGAADAMHKQVTLSLGMASPLCPFVSTEGKSLSFPSQFSYSPGLWINSVCGRSARISTEIQSVGVHYDASGEWTYGTDSPATRNDSNPRRGSQTIVVRPK
jgi:hypothetical protein